ncbi:MAG: hypothetical protein ABSA02_26625 [Trebonia sp.]|jgi:hypothetical protein
MNDKAAGNRGPRRAIALSVGAAAAAILAAACGGGAPSSSASTPTYTQELALATCMRSHGVPNFPDPDTSGGYTLTASGTIEGAGGSPIDIDSSQAQAAYGDCRHLLPGAPSISQLEQRVQEGQQRQAQNLPELLKWEQCVRGHGQPTFSLPLGGQSPAPANGAAINPSSPRFQAALTACQYLLPPGVQVSTHTSTSAS